MAGGGVDKARACVIGDMIAVEEWNVEVVAQGFEWMVATPSEAVEVTNMLEEFSTLPAFMTLRQQDFLQQISFSHFRPIAFRCRQ